jgi:hypothetical protein
MNKYFKMDINWTFVIIAFIIIVYILKTNQHTFEEPQDYYFNPNCVNLFWTGGYDSTFRLLQLVLIENKCVNPIYLNFDGLDGINIRRKNVQYELNAMEKIINELNVMGYGKLVNPLTIVTHVELDCKVSASTAQLYNDGHLRRPVSQYAHMVQFSLDQNIIIEEGAEKSNHSTSYKMITPYLNKNKMLDINKIRHRPELYVIRNLRFPIIDLTKKDMLNIAKKHNFDHILNFTKSCWHPSKTGAPCMLCSMCKDRIIVENFRS